MYLISSKDTFFNQVSESFEKNKDKNKDKQSSNPPKKRNMDYNPFENTKSKTGIDMKLNREHVIDNMEKKMRFNDIVKQYNLFFNKKLKVYDKKYIKRKIQINNKCIL